MTYGTSHLLTGGGIFRGEGQEKILLCKGGSLHDKTLKIFSSFISLTRHFTKFIFLEQLTAMPQFTVQNIFFCFFLSSHHDTNPLLHLYHFRKKYNYILANINSESSRVIFSFFFCLHPVGQTFLYPSNFCNHLKHSAK